MQVIQSTKLANVCYDIRGPVLEEAMRLQAAGHRVLELNTGNPAPFGFECPPEILEDMLRSLGDGARLRELQGHPAGPPRGHAALPDPGHRAGRRGRLPRQRRLRADPDVHAGAARRRRRGAGPRAGLPAVDGVRLAVRRHRRALPLRRAGGLAARPRRHRAQDHRPHQGDRDHQPEQPDGRGLRRRDAARHRRDRPQAPADRLRRRDLRQDPVRRRDAHAVRRHRARPAHADLQRAVEGVPRGRLPQRVARGVRAQGRTPPATSRA